jgi:hypothetical protein
MVGGLGGHEQPFGHVAVRDPAGGEHPVWSRLEIQHGIPRAEGAELGEPLLGLFGEEVCGARIVRAVPSIPNGRRWLRPVRGAGLIASLSWLTCTTRIAGGIALPAAPFGNPWPFRRSWTSV